MEHERGVAGRRFYGFGTRTAPTRWGALHLPVAGSVRTDADKQATMLQSVVESLGFPALVRQR